MKILLADDDQDQLELRSLLLAKKGFEPIAVTTAAAALREAKEQHPRCAVIDLKIPSEAHGLELIRNLKAFDAGIRVFVLTGGDASRINRLPEITLVEEVIVKGSSIANLLKKLRDLESNEEPQLAGWRAQLTKNGVVTFDVKAVPRAARSEVVGVTNDGAMKVRVAAVPDKGKANEELRNVLAAWFQVSKNKVELLHGETSPRKVWRVTK
jgi:uncharacterized protein (TIGR00251 family)